VQKIGFNYLQLLGSLGLPCESPWESLALKVYPPCSA
jgi:hypothetical protein